MLYSIQMTQFEASAQIAQVLQDYQCQFVEFTDKETSTPPMGVKVKAILSAAFEVEMGGLKNVIELIKKRGAKSIAIISENAEAFSVEKSMNGALLRIALPATEHP